MKKLFSYIVALCMVVAVFPQVTAMAVTDVDDGHQMGEITQFAYEIIDEDGNVTERGIIPDSRLRYSWNGIVLENGETIMLVKTNGEGFYMTNNTAYEFSYTLDRAAQMQNMVTVSPDRTLSSGERVHFGNSSGIRYTLNTRAPQTGYYAFGIRSATSDPIIITSVSVVF